MRLAQWMTSRVSYPPAPASTGTLPAASSTTSCHDADALVVASASGLSPVVPHGTRKWMPASICRRARRLTAASSSAPSRVNGVTSAVPHPVQAFASCPPTSPQRQLYNRIPHRSVNPNTSRIENHPRRPLTHWPLKRAACEPGAVARGVRQRDRVGRGCRTRRYACPGSNPRASTPRRSAARTRPAASSSRIAIAVPDGASRLALWWSSWIQAPNSGRSASSFAARAASARNRFTPRAKFGAETTPIGTRPSPARGLPSWSASQSCQSRGASRARRDAERCRHGRSGRKVDRHVGGRPLVLAGRHCRCPHGRQSPLPFPAPATRRAVPCGHARQ